MQQGVSAVCLLINNLVICISQFTNNYEAMEVPLISRYTWAQPFISTSILITILDISNFLKK